MIGVLGRRRVSLVILLATVFLVVSAVGANSIESVDTAGDVGKFTSLALDVNGYPVVSYYDVDNGDLKVLHCNDADCAGGDESIESVDATGYVGQYGSLALDENGYPVVSYWDATNADLKVLHCNDPNCAGGDESIQTMDTEGFVGSDTSLALDVNGYPVVSYWDGSNDDLKLLHCNDPDCVGGDESIEAVDTAGNVGMFTSLALDVNGYPVVSYYDNNNYDLKVLHCNDPNCAGGDESIESVDTATDVGWFTSLVLDANGYPLVSYYDVDNGDLKVLHCNDANCADGDESIESVDTEGDVGLLTSLALDAEGNPVVSYYDDDNYDLKVLHCNDPNCADGDESIESVDTAGNVGEHTSLALDADNNPVVSHYDDANGDLKLLHCSNVYCSPPAAPEVEAGADVTVDEGAAVEFAGSASDVNEDDFSVAWEFGDGATASGTLTPMHTYADEGVYTVTLTATDEHGMAASDTLTVTVENVAPVVDAGPNAPALESMVVSLAGSFTDVGALDTHTVEWDFGDGGTASDTLTPSHTYNDDGVYTVTLTVTDNGSGVGVDTLTVTVLNVAPLVNALAQERAVAGAPLTFAGSFSDLGVEDTHTVEWDFGDGETAVGTLTPVHTYSALGTYTATLTVTDDDGGVGMDTLTVTVVAAPVEWGVFLPGWFGG